LVAEHLHQLAGITVLIGLIGVGGSTHWECHLMGLAG
jgi:hypothetical protein